MVDSDIDWFGECSPNSFKVEHDSIPPMEATLITDTNRVKFDLLESSHIRCSLS